MNVAGKPPECQAGNCHTSVLVEAIQSDTVEWEFHIRRQMRLVWCPNIVVYLSEVAVVTTPVPFPSHCLLGARPNRPANSWDKDHNCLNIVRSFPNILDWYRKSTCVRKLEKRWFDCWCIWLLMQVCLEQSVSILNNRRTANTNWAVYIKGWAKN